PVPDFVVRTGRLWHLNGMPEKPAGLGFFGEGHNGEFVSRLQAGEFGGRQDNGLSITVLQLESKDYMAGVIEFPSALDASTNIFVVLSPRHELAGQVFLPAGQPAAEAEIALIGN